MTLQIPKSKGKSKGKNNNIHPFDNVNATQIIINNSVLDKLKYLHSTHGNTVQASYSEIIERLLMSIDTQKFRELNLINDDE